MRLLTEIPRTYVESPHVPATPFLRPALTFAAQVRRQMPTQAPTLGNRQHWLSRNDRLGHDRRVLRLRSGQMRNEAATNHCCRAFPALFTTTYCDPHIHAHNFRQHHGQEAANGNDKFNRNVSFRHKKPPSPHVHRSAWRYLSAAGRFSSCGCSGASPLPGHPGGRRPQIAVWRRCCWR